MTDEPTNALPKVHPATREMLSEDPLELQGFEIPGDPDLMLRLLVEEYARMGANAEAVMDLARNPFYQSFHGLYALFGEAGLRRRVAEVFARVGVTRVRFVEAPAAEQLVEIALPTKL